MADDNTDVPPEVVQALVAQYRDAQARQAGVVSRATAPPTGGLSPAEQQKILTDQKAAQATNWALDPNNVTQLAQTYSQPGVMQAQQQQAQRDQSAGATFAAEDKSKAAQQSMGLSDRDRAAYQTFLEEDARKAQAQQTLTPDQQAAIRAAQANAATAQQSAAQMRAAQPYQGPTAPYQVAAMSDRHAKIEVRPAVAKLAAFLQTIGGRRA